MTFLSRSAIDSFTLVKIEHYFLNKTRLSNERSIAGVTEETAFLQA
ncbi:hypothetical protein RV06_GL002535 [Enterococcus haemoperoxidus]|nr:hypothetical protein RV06_GL002535 [Enterococcus haemoperoxidus]